MGLKFGSSSVNRAISLILKNVFKSKGRSGSFKNSRCLVTNFSCSDKIGNSTAT